MILVTGDVHGHIDIIKFNDIKNQLRTVNIELTRDDYIIVAGDFGIPWYHYDTLVQLGFDMSSPDVISNLQNDANLIEYFDGYPATILFIDGNHENYFVLDELEEIEKFGNKVGKLSENIFHLKRGNVYNIDGLKIFTFGGAKSIDKDRRIDGLSWWSREIPSEIEWMHGFDELEKHNFEVDYVITHTAPRSIIQLAQHLLYIYGKLDDTVAERLDVFLQNNLKFKKWLCGHFHVDGNFYNFRFIYNNFEEIF